LTKVFFRPFIIPALLIDRKEFQYDLFDTKLPIESLVRAGSRELRNEWCHMFRDIECTGDEINLILASAAVVLFNPMERGDNTIGGCQTTPPVEACTRGIVIKSTKTFGPVFNLITISAAPTPEVVACKFAEHIFYYLMI
jgi:hypothetical protein